jgi:hypothetical protein
VLLTTTFFSNIIQVSVLASAVIFALVVALDLVGMVAVQVLGSEHEAQAKECNNSIAFNTSKGRCFHTWLGEEVRIDP